MAHFTRSCSGCTNSEDGHLIGEYPWDEKAQCHVGAGCHECGYTGKRRVYFNIKELEKQVAESDREWQESLKRKVS